MKHAKVEKAALKARSEELKIPFSNLLAGYVLEELMYLIMDSPFSGTLLLKNDSIFGIDQYRKENILTLEFAYLLDNRVIKSGEFKPGQEISLKLAYLMLANFLKKEKAPEIKWRGRTVCNENEIEMTISGEFEEMSVPISIRIRPMQDQEIPIEKGVLYPFMEDDKKIEYLRYPWELALSENLYAILRDMELIPEMQAYDTVYQILHRQLINGRHIWELISFYCERDQMDTKEERVEEILSYQDYTYMRKRWEKYARHQKDAKPSWEEVMDTIKSFLPAIWNSICKDEIFFGDWMPELERFL